LQAPRSQAGDIAFAGPLATGWRLDAPVCPFPVLPMHTPLRPDLAKLGEQPLLAEDTEWADWVTQKCRALASGAFQVLVSAQLSPQQQEQLASLVATALIERLPQGPIAANRALPWLEGRQSSSGPITTRSAEEFFLGLTLSLQEDFAVMVPDAAGLLRARVLSVCFPSGWCPAEKLDRSFSQLHEPVADAQDLMAAAPALSQAMCSKGPFVRYVWTIAGNGDRGRLPGVDSFAHAASIDDLWFRCERQVTVPLAGQASLFLIRVFVTPLRQAVPSAERWVTLQEALASMSPAMVAYKGLGRAINIISNDTSFSGFHRKRADDHHV